MPGKICSKCKVFKSYNRFNKDCTKSDNHKPSCKTCRKIESKNYVTNNKERLKDKYHSTKNNESVNKKRIYDSKRKIQCKNNYIKRTYGINLSDYKELKKQQNNKCAICNKIFDESKQAVRGNVDHCHKTGKVRGILCLNCNTSLGHFNDDINLLRSAIKYLEKQNE